MKVVTALLFFTFSATCISIVRGIGGGHFGYIKDFPYAVSVQVMKQHRCGGSIIGERHILTAAHCFNDNINADDVTVMSGTDDLYSPNPYINGVTKIITHPKYNDNDYSNDIAVLKLKETLAFSKTRQLIRLPDKLEIIPRVYSKLCGWGPAHENGVELSRQLKKLDLRVFSNNDDKNNYGSGPILYAMTKDGVDTRGDDGGGLVIEGVIVGVLCITPRKFDYVAPFSRVFYYKPWILEAMEY